MNIKRYAIGIGTGFLFGTAGILLLALMAQTIPGMSIIAAPFLWPGKLFALALTQDGSIDIADIVLLYVSSGILYGALGGIIHAVIRHTQHPDAS